MQTDPRIAGRPFLAVLLVGLLWRAFLAFGAVPAWEARAGVGSTPDAYPLLAQTLVERGTFGYAGAGASPTTVRGPGFPMWLAASVALGLDDPRWLAFWGGLPGVLAGAWLASWCARTWGFFAGLTAGAVAVLHPLPSLVASRAMGDDFYAALGFGGLALWVAALQSATVRRSALLTLAAGALLGLQILARASGVLTLLVAGAALLGGRRDRGRRAGLAALLAGVALAPALAWSVRTSRLEGRPVFVHSLAAYNFWIGEGFHRMGAGEPPSGNYPEIVRFALARAGPDFAQEGFWYASLEPRRAAELERRLGAAARERLLRDPLGYAVRVVQGIPAYWFAAQTRARALQYAWVVVPVLVLAALGVRRAAAESLGRLLLLTLVAHNLAYAAVLPAARMSVQVYPALACLAGAGAARIAQMRMRSG
jgi:hypothetical protein